MLDACRQFSARITSRFNLLVGRMDFGSLTSPFAKIARLDGATRLALEDAA